MKRCFLIVPVVALAALAQTSSGPTREGAYWVDTVTGSAPVGESLRVSIEGAVKVQGEQRGDVAYVLKRRVRARDAAAARALLERGGVKARRQGALTILGVMRPESRQASVDLQLRVPRRLRELTVESAGGAIEVSDLDGTARVATAAGAVDVSRVAGDVAIRTAGGAVKLDKIGGMVDCYTSGGSIMAGLLGGEATLGTAGGEIVVHDARGLIRARTQGGSIRIEQARRGVQAAAANGLVDVLQAGGPVKVETGTGSIRVRSASDVHCESSMGMIQLQATSGGLRAITRTGSILADLSGVQKIEDSALVTSAGDITVLIPSNLRVTVEAVNSTGGRQRIISDFGGVRQRPGNGSVDEVAVNGGGPLLRLTTAAGTIYLRRPR